MALVARPAGRRAVLVAVSALAAVLLLVLPSAGTAGASGTAPHRLPCVLIRGRLYLGSPGAGTNPQFVTCAIRLDQVRPLSDGVILVLQYARRTSTYSILRIRLPVPPSGRFPIPWLHHRGPVEVGCALSGGRLYLGRTGPSRPRRIVICSISFYQLVPSTDGVLAVLRQARNRSAYSVVLRPQPHRPTGFVPIPWKA